MAIINVGDSPTLRSAVAPESREALEPAAALFRSLSDVTRLTIVQHLLLGEHRVVDLVEHLGLAQSTISSHVACLRDCGLLSSRVRGRATHYSLADPELITRLLGSTEAVLAASGNAVSLCTAAKGGAQ